MFLKTNEFKIKMNEIKYLIWKGTAWVSHSSPSQALRLRLHARVSEPVPNLLLFHLPRPPNPRTLLCGWEDQEGRGGAAALRGVQ